MFKFRSVPAVPVTAYFVPLDCILPSVRVNVPSCSATFPAKLEKATGAPRPSRTRWRSVPLLQWKSEVPLAEVRMLATVIPDSDTLYSASRFPVAQLSCISDATCDIETLLTTPLPMNRGGETVKSASQEPSCWPPNRS